MFSILLWWDEVCFGWNVKLILHNVCRRDHEKNKVGVVGWMTCIILIRYIYMVNGDCYRLPHIEA